MHDEGKDTTITSIIKFEKKNINNGLKWGKLKSCYGWQMNRFQHTREINGYKLKNHYEYGMN